MRKSKVKRSVKKAEARAATMRQHAKQAEIGINPKYLNTGIATITEKEWLKLSRAWDEANAPREAA